jgi:hypothetical protein
MNPINFTDNMALIEELWPKYRMEPSLRSIIVEKWGSLHQDKLRECIRQHRLERDTKPDVAAIHKAYCRITGADTGSDVSQREIARTRRQAEETKGPTEAEIEAWDYWAEAIISSATNSELKEIRERFNLEPTHRRYLACMVDYIRRHPLPR